VTIDAVELPFILKATQAIDANHRDAQQTADALFDVVGDPATLSSEDARRLVLGRDLVFSLSRDDEQLTVVDPSGKPRNAPLSWKTDNRFGVAHFEFSKLHREPVIDGAARADLFRHARTLGSLLFEALFDGTDAATLEKLIGPDRPRPVIQIRSDDLGKWQVFGYQVEIAKADVMGLWHHSLLDKAHPKRQARFLMSTAGEKAVIVKDGTRANTKLRDAAEVQAKYKEHEWNTMEIIAKGDRLVQKINGVHFATLIDQDAEMSRAKGLIAFQDHGKGCTVAFRNVRLKETSAK